MISDEDYSKILIALCVVHQLNLLLQSIMSIPSINALFSLASKLTSKINRSSILLGNFRRIQEAKGVRIALVNLCSTRFYTFSDVLRSILKNEEPLKQLAIDRQCAAILGDSLRAAILDPDTFEQLGVLRSLVANLADAIAIMERDSCRLSDVSPMFNRL